MTSVWLVRATEDDYYPMVEILGVFTTKEEAEAYAAAQPPRVKLWPDTAYSSVRYFDYTVEEIQMSPAGQWRPEAP